MDQKVKIKMAEEDLKMEIHEASASVKMLDKKLEALIQILEKEGITTKDEVEEKTSGLLGGQD